MSHTLTRRSLVSAAPAAIIAATVPALAAEHPDAALLALRKPYMRSLAVLDATSGPHSRAEDAYFAMKQGSPELDERALRKASGLIVAERAWSRANTASLAIVHQIGDLSAHTLEGIRFKAEVSDREGNSEPDLMASIVADLVAMGGAHA